MEAVPRSERATLSRDLSEFLIELSIALHRHSMYPSGHPALTPAIESVTRRAEKLLEDRPSIAFGVARRQLIIDGVTTDPDQPVLRRLADGLHKHHIGAVSILRGVEVPELGDALHALSAEADREGPLGLKATVATWPHVKLHPLTFDGLALAGASTGSGGAAEAETAQGSELWIGLARAALASDEKQEPGAVNSEPSAVAKAIDENSGRAEAYDQIIVGYLVQIARELKTASGEQAVDLRRRTSRLIASLKPGTLRRLVSMGDRQQRRQFVADVANGMAVDAVLEIVKASADASGQTISHGLVRMLTKLARHAERGTDLIRPRADVELREQVGRLLDDWRLEDPNPEAYGQVLEHLSTSKGADVARPGWAVAADPEPLRMLQMCLEANAFGPLADKAIDQVINAGQLNGLLELIATPPEGGQAGAETILARLTRPENLKGLFSGDRVDLSGLDHLLPRLSVDGYEPLLEALGSSPNRIVRRRLLDVLGRTQVDITPLVIRRLNDERWYVQRNMLTLLSRGRQLPDTFTAIPWAQHADTRVRSEAIRLQLTMAAEREFGMHAALNDPDPRIVHLGLTALHEECPPHLVDRVIDLALASDLGDDSRVLAVNALSRVHVEPVLEALLQLSIGGRSLLRRIRLLPKSPVLIAAIRTLATAWSTEPRAAGVLAAAARSSDPQVRGAISPMST